MLPSLDSMPNGESRLPDGTTIPPDTLPTEGHNGIPSHTPHSHEANGISFVPPAFQLLDSPVDHTRPLRVRVIGAGYSGIYLGIRIPQRLRGVDLKIYDKNPEVGGTWFENKYAGVACDVPSHSYQYAFAPTPNWSSVYAPGQEIQEYLAATAEKYSVHRFLRLSHKVEQCVWSDGEGLWYLKIRNLLTGEMVEETSEIVISAVGLLNEPKWPDIKGFGTFQGEVMHSAKWNESYDFTNKRVGLIGTGSSAIQILPCLQKVASHVFLYTRNPTFISPSFQSGVYEALGFTGAEITPAQRELLAKDPSTYIALRLRVEEAGNDTFKTIFRDSPECLAFKQRTIESMRTRLATKPDIFTAMLPDFSPACRRLTPGPGYLEALTQPNVSFVTDPIATISSHGIHTQSGADHSLDALVCATGFVTSTAPPFPIIGQNGVTLAQNWSSYPRTYMSLVTDNFPNLFLMLGPNGWIGSGALTPMMEAMGDYIVRCVRKVQKERVKSMVVKRARVDDFVEYARAFFKDTVFAEECRSWYKGPSGDVTAIWPGSGLHFCETLRSPRWEDFEYEYLGPEEGGTNALAFLGNGWTRNQMDSKHLASYLYDRYVDFPNAPRPEEGGEFEARLFTH